MKVEKITPEINKVYFIEQHTLIHILSGKGGIEVDFKQYFDWEQKAIFLEKGQYIKFLSDSFIVRRIEFSNVDTFYNDEIRVLFKHLISLGYIDLMECQECQSFLSKSMLPENATNIIDISSKQWYWQNPFNANKEEYQIIFDTKDVIDQEYQNQLSSDDLVALINDQGYDSQKLIRSKIGLSVKNLMREKIFRESKKELAFSDKSVQEIAYDLGFKDDAYFNRVFKKATTQTPKKFRENFDYKNRDLFMQDIINLIEKHHTQERTLGFYADQLHISVKTLSKKVKQKMNTSLGNLIRLEIMNTAKSMLLQGETITTTSHQLGFSEPNHFTRFFKNYTGTSPSNFKLEKYNS